MFYDKFHILLTSIVVLLPVGFLITYLIAVFNGHVEAGFPYISDTGTIPPESCIFGQILSIGSFLTIIIIYIRYHHVKLIITNFPEYNYLDIFNKFGFVVGILSMIGISLVGNFQELNVLTVHIIGAMMAFGLLIVYGFVHTCLAYKLRLVLSSSNTLLAIRLMLITLSIIFFISTILFGNIASDLYNTKNGDGMKWGPSDGGFAEHVVSTVTEWSMAFTEMLILFTFYSDMKRIRVRHPQIEDYKLCIDNKNENA